MNWILINNQLKHETEMACQGCDQIDPLMTDQKIQEHILEKRFKKKKNFKYKVLREGNKIEVKYL